MPGVTRLLRVTARLPTQFSRAKSQKATPGHLRNGHWNTGARDDDPRMRIRAIGHQTIHLSECTLFCGTTDGWLGCERLLSKKIAAQMLLAHTVQMSRSCTSRALLHLVFGERLAQQACSGTGRRKMDRYSAPWVRCPLPQIPSPIRSASYRVVLEICPTTAK